MIPGRESLNGHCSKVQPLSVADNLVTSPDKRQPCHPQAPGCEVIKRLPYLLRVGLVQPQAQSNYSKLKLPVIYKKGRERPKSEEMVVSPSWILKRKEQNSQKSSRGVEKTARCGCRLLGVRMAAGSGPRDDLKKRLG